MPKNWVEFSSGLVTRFVIHCAALVTAGLLRADALKDASEWRDLIDSAKQHGINWTTAHFANAPQASGPVHKSF